MNDKINLSDVARGESTIEPDQRLISMLSGLRHFVDNPNIRPAMTLKNGIFQQTDRFTPQAIMYNGFEIAYKMADPPGPYMTRTAFILYEDQPLSEIPERELEPILTAVLAVLIDNMVAAPKIYSPGDEYPRPDGVVSTLNRHMIIIEQHFIPELLTERQPRQRVPNNPASKPTIH